MLIACRGKRNCTAARAGTHLGQPEYFFLRHRLQRPPPQCKEIGCGCSGIFMSTLS